MAKLRTSYLMWLLAVPMALASLAFTAVPAFACGGAVLCVDKDAAGPSHNGLTWTTAYTNVQEALAAATSGTEIWVAEGAYTPTGGTDRTATFQLKDDVAVYGGFGGTETARDERDPAAHIVVLSGDLSGDDGSNWANNGENSYHVVTGATAPLDGVIISGGNANGTDPYDRGGGLFNINSVHPALTDVTISGNFAAYAGGGMYNLHSYPVLTRVVFNGNSATEGGGMYSLNSSLSLADVTFSDNSADNGGGMYNNSSSSTLTNITFSGNSAGNGGGIYNSSSSPALTNITFSGNSAGNGGALYNHSSSPTLTNVTFSGNSADHYGGGIYNDSPGPVNRNSILWGNTASFGYQVYNAHSNAAFINSVIQGGCPSDSVCTNIITADPLLGSFGNYGGSIETFPLRPGSPALDAAGSNCPATDGRGVTRSTPVCDIGAFESQGFTLAITGGDHQSAPASTMFLQPLELTVTANDPLEPVSGGRVIFTGPSSGASTNPVTSGATIAAGGAVVQLVTANPISGTYAVTPTVNATTSVTFSLENTAWVPVLYATPGGATTGFCDSWADACELRYALTRAVSGQEIWVTAGTYTPAGGADRNATFQLKNGVTIYGGFVGTETARDQRDWTAQVVVLSGDLNGDDGPNFANNGENIYHVVKGATGATLDGVTISGGNASGDYSLLHDQGGGMLNSSSSPTLTHVIFSGNRADDGGGGMYNSNSSPILTHVTFSGNAATRGGGVYNYDSSPILTHVTFSGNVATIGGGMGNETYSSPKLTNVTFSSNTATDRGGGILNWASSLVLTNVTFSGNTASNGGGLYNGGSPGSAQVRNSIFWANSGGEIVNIGTFTIQDSVVQGGYSGGTNIITADPLLGSLGDYGGSTKTLPLRPGSSAIDTGNATYCTLGHDQRGVSHVGGCDIGAFESQGFTLMTTGGDGQTAPITTIFTQPLALTVRANDPAEPVNGGLVTFTGPLSGASTNPVTNVVTITGGAVSQLVTANLITGSYTVTASANGTAGAGFALTNSWATVYTTTTTLTSSPNPSTYSTPVSFTATVTSTGGTPQGSVQLYIDGAPLGSAVPLSNGQAVLTTPLIDLGTHPISATYSGGPYYIGSTSPALSQGVNCGMAVTVLNADDSGVGSLRSAIPRTCDGGIITFNGDYTVTLTSVLTIDKGLTISGAGHTVGVSGNNVTQMFTVTAGVSVTLQHLTLASGSGSIFNRGRLTVADSTLTNNLLGTITNDSGATLAVLRTTITNNSGGLLTSGPASAGILNRGVLTITDSVFSGNQFTRRSDGGTALSNVTGGVAVVTGSSFDSNNGGASSMGGGAIANQGQMTIDDCSFTGNSQPAGGYGGGAIIHYAGALTVTGSVFSHNTSGTASTMGLGGAISHRSGTLTVTGSTFDGNSAYAYGGAIVSLYSLTLTNNTFRGNSVPPGSSFGWGGALVAGSNDSSATFDLTNNTFVSNTATTGGNLYFVLAGPTVNLYNNILLQGASGGNCSIASGLTPNASHNLADDTTCGMGFGDASALLLGEFGNYGGSTSTFPLLPGSSAIDAGDDAPCPATDQRGVARPQGAGCDIGAYEAAPVLAIAKSVLPAGPVPYHSVVTYTIVLTNSGGTPAANLSLTDTLPAGVTFGQWLQQPGSGLVRTGSAITWTGTLAANTALPLSFTATHTGNSFDVITNTAFFSGTLQNGSAAATFNVLCLNTITVQNTNDSGPGSLRQAIADVCSGGTINFAAGLAGQTLTLTSAELTIARTVTIINSHAPGLQLSGNNARRVFSIQATGVVTLSSLAVVNGMADYGGGIVNEGVLVINASIYSGNRASGEYFDTGGAIYNSGILTINHSTFNGNQADYGGGVNNYGTLTVNNSTFGGNQAGSEGGGVNNQATLTVNNSTFSGNQAGSDGGGISNYGTLHLRNSIIANSPAGGDCRNHATIATNANNLIEATGSDACGIASGVGGSIIGLDPLLAPLDDHGGSTQTFALLPGSPALNAGDHGEGCLATDQRGIARPQGTACDIGAFESRGFTLTYGSGSNQSTLINTAFTNPLTLTITSSFTEPVEDGQVIFTAPGSGASTNPAVYTATINGGAVTQVVTANNTVGSYAVTATARGNLGSPASYALTNIAPEIAVLGNGIEIASGDTTPDPADHTNFGSAAVASGQITRTFTISNSGGANLNLTGTPLISITGPAALDFSLVLSPTTPLAPGETTTFQVRFDPTVTGTRVVTVIIANDDSDENPYNFAIQGTGTIPVVQFSQAAYQVNENGTAAGAVVALSRTGLVDVASQVEVSFTDDTATGGGIDYTSDLLTISFPAGSTEAQTVTVPINQDFMVELAESLTMTVASLNNAQIGSQGTAVLQIVDDDSAGVLVSPSTALTISEPSGSDTFNIRLTSRPTATVTIDLTVSDSSACSVAPDPVTLTDVTWQTGVTVTVVAVDDFVTDGPQECRIVTAQTSSSDPVYDTIFNPDDVTVTVNDDDLPDIRVSPTTGLTTTETGSTSAFTVRLGSQPTAPVTITLTSSDATEGVISPAALIFSPAAWQLAQTVTVTGLDDLIADGNQPYTIQTHPASSSDGLYDGRDPADVSLVNLDDDSAGFNLNPTGLTISEPAGVATFTLKLTSQPVATVTVDLTVGDATECGVSPNSTTLDATNWHMGVTITVTAVDDDLVDGDQPCGVSGLFSSGDGNYHNRAFNLMVTVKDDDVSPLYLPLIMNGFTSAVTPGPDLVIDSLSSSSSGPQVVIHNAGSTPVTDPFWVDVYFNPTPAPPPLNRTWQSIAPYGAHWGVTETVDPGETLTLTLGGPYYVDGSGMFPAGVPVYACVDSINYATTYGNVQESSEANNVFGPVVSVASASEPVSSPHPETAPPAGLPGR